MLSKSQKKAIVNKEAVLKPKKIGKKVLSTSLKKAIKGKEAELKPKKIGKKVTIATLALSIAIVVISTAQHLNHRRCPHH